MSIPILNFKNKSEKVPMMDFYLKDLEKFNE